MPELPEVETIVNDLRDKVAGRRIVAVEVATPTFIGGRVGLLHARQSPDEFRDRLVGKRIAVLRRRAKYLVFSLDSGDYLLMHLAMTGRLVLHQQGTACDKAIRAIFVLDDGAELRLSDVRKFGYTGVVGPDALAALDARLGPEPLTPEFDVGELARRLQKTARLVKTLLLDQGFVAGLGNIYADEALFIAKLHPQRPANSLSPDEIQRLHAAIRGALLQGIEDRGTTIATYVDATGEKGRHQERLQAYGRAGRPCPRCGLGIQRVEIAGRSAHFCPNCQKPEGRGQGAKEGPTD